MTWTNPAYGLWQLADESGRIVARVNEGHHCYAAYLVAPDSTAQVGLYTTSAHAQRACEHALGAVTEVGR